jgi:hypothetical protein
MPWALPFVNIGLGTILLPALGIITVAVLAWYLTTPSGFVTWKKIRDWADVQIKQPVEEAFKGIKNGLKDVAKAWDDFRIGLKAYIQTAYDYVVNTRVYIMDYIYDHVLSRVRNLESWKDSFVKWIYGAIYADVLLLLSWKASFSNWVSNTIYSRLQSLEKWKTNFLTWIDTAIVKPLANAINDIKNLKKSLADMVESLSKTIDSVKAGLLVYVSTLVQSIGDDVLPNIGERLKDLASKLSKAIGIPSLLAIIGTWIGTLINDVAKRYKKDVDNLENLDIDWLLVAYLAITKPILIDRADDVINILADCYKQITRIKR